MYISTNIETSVLSYILTWPHCITMWVFVLLSVSFWSPSLQKNTTHIGNKNEIVALKGDSCSVKLVGQDRENLMIVSDMTRGEGRELWYPWSWLTWELTPLEVEKSTMTLIFKEGEMPGEDDAIPIGWRQKAKIGTVFGSCNSNDVQHIEFSLFYQFIKGVDRNIAYVWFTSERACQRVAGPVKCPELLVSWTIRPWAANIPEEIL